MTAGKLFVSKSFAVQNFLLAAPATASVVPFLFLRGAVPSDPLAP
jgi:hypothetical protein